jgi:hypothetical protein
MAFTGAIGVRDARGAGDVAGSAALIGGGGGGRRVCNAMMPCHDLAMMPREITIGIPSLASCTIHYLYK